MSTTSRSELDRNERLFYEGSGEQNHPIPAVKKTQQAFIATGEKKEPVNQNSQHFTKAKHDFYGEKYQPSDKGSEKGSVFQANAAAFYEVEKPKHGERPFKINEENLKDNRPAPGKSVLNEMRLREHERNMERDPKFGKNLRKFWGLKSNATASQPSSFA